VRGGGVSLDILTPAGDSLAPSIQRTGPDSLVLSRVIIELMSLPDTTTERTIPYTLEVTVR